MADLLNVTSLITISQAEVSRANAALTQVDSLKVEVDSLKVRNVALDTEVKRLTALLVVRDARIRELEALVPVVPPVVVPPVVVPPVTSKTGLYVDGSKLRTKNGSEFQIRGIELMCNGDTVTAGYQTVLAMCKTFGANTVSPLFQGNTGTVANVKTFIDTARSLGLIVGCNADHQSDGRSWMNAPGMVTLLNGYDNVFLECEVETDDVDTTPEWSTAAIALLKSVRDAGHKSPMKVGAPQGGRHVKYPLAAGKEVLATDPLKNTMFTFQAYWKAAVSSGWTYQGDNGFNSGVAGTKEAFQACLNSGLCFLVGLDWKDNVGLTDLPACAAELHRLGMNYQIWALRGDTMYPENCILSHWNHSASSITPTGIQMTDILKAQSKLAVL